MIAAFQVATAVDIIPDHLFNIDKDVTIDLFTLKNTVEPQILVLNDTKSVLESNYNKKIPTRIFIHGYHSKKGSLRNAFVNGE